MPGHDETGAQWGVLSAVVTPARRRRRVWNTSCFSGGYCSVGEREREREREIDR